MDYFRWVSHNDHDDHHCNHDDDRDDHHCNYDNNINHYHCYNSDNDDGDDDDDDDDDTASDVGDCELLDSLFIIIFISNYSLLELVDGGDLHNFLASTVNYNEGECCC